MLTSAVGFFVALVLGIIVYEVRNNSTENARQFAEIKRLSEANNNMKERIDRMEVRLYRFIDKYLQAAPVEGHPGR